MPSALVQSANPELPVRRYVPRAGRAAILDKKRGTSACFKTLSSWERSCFKSLSLWERAG
jgi:hypothetical protein